MMPRSFAGKTIAAVLVVALHVLTVPALASPDTATLTGRVVAVSDQAPLSGARVYLGDPATGKIVSSAPTGSDGVFRLEGVPATTYEVAIQSGDRMYVVGEPVQLASGDRRGLQLAVQTRQLAPAQSDEKKDKGAPTMWDNPGVATAVVVGGAFLIGWLIDVGTDDEEESSPYTPPGE